MIEKLEEYPFLAEEEEIMTWKDGIRRERIKRTMDKKKTRMERMEEKEMINKKKRRLEVEL